MQSQTSTLHLEPKMQAGLYTRIERSKRRTVVRILQLLVFAAAGVDPEQPA